MEKLKRIMLKLSGEALADGKGSYNDDEIVNIAKQVKTIVDGGTDVAIVIGGGNYWRGRTGIQIDRPKSDSIGMLATIMNCIYVSEHFRYAGMKTAILTPFPCSNMTEIFSKDLANEYFRQHKVLFFAGGTGHPYFTTDTCMALRAIELNVDLILAAKAIDGVYDKDPAKNPDAKKFDKISIGDVIANNLQVVDMTASILARDNHMPMDVFSLNEENSIVNTLYGKFNGTRVTV